MTRIVLTIGSPTDACRGRRLELREPSVAVATPTSDDANGFIYRIRYTG